MRGFDGHEIFFEGLVFSEEVFDLEALLQYGHLRLLCLIVKLNDALDTDSIHDLRLPGLFFFLRPSFSRQRFLRHESVVLVVDENASDVKSEDLNNTQGSSEFSEKSVPGEELDFFFLDRELGPHRDSEDATSETLKIFSRLTLHLHWIGLH